MKSKWVWALLALVLGAGLYGGTVLATPPSGVTTTTIGIGRFDPIDTKTKTGAWKAKIRTRGTSDLHVIQNTIRRAGPLAGTATPVPAS